MFKYISFIRSVKTFIVKDNILYYVNAEDTLFVNSKPIANSYGIEASENSIFSYYNMYDVSTKILFSNGKIIDTNYALSSHAFNGLDTIINNKDANDKNKQKGLYNIESRKIKWFNDVKKFGNANRVENNLYCRQSHTIINSLSLITGEYNWTTDLSHYSSEKETVKIKKILGIWRNKLVVEMDNNDLIVLLSLVTGEITAEIWNIKAQFPKEGPWGFGWHFHLEGDYVYLLQQNRYLRIDLTTQQIETLWIPENINFNIQRVSYDEQYAYFMACDGYHVYTDILGVFDRKALKIVWQYTEPIYSSQPPQSAGNKLYCLDNGGVLHIFEKEENEKNY